MDILINGGTIIQHVYMAGAEIWLAGDKIKIQPVSILPEKLRCELKQYREDVVHALQRYPVPLIGNTYQRGIFDHGYALDESEIIKLIPPSDWDNVSQCDDFELRSWAKVVALRAIRYRGIVPRDWNKVTKCSHCGWVFSVSAGDCEPCSWCELRVAGVRFPTPGLNRCTHPKLIDGCVIQESKIQSDNIGVIIRECFFCGEQHMHGTSGETWGKRVEKFGGNRHLGHRQNKCVRNDIKMTLVDGTIVCSEHGYYLGIGDQQPNVSN